MEKVWVVNFDEYERMEQNAVFSTREKANAYAVGIERYNCLGDVIITDFSKISREEDDFDIYQYKDEYGIIYNIIIAEYEIR